MATEDLDAASSLERKFTKSPSPGPAWPNALVITLPCDVFGAGLRPADLLVVGAQIAQAVPVQFRIEALAAHAQYFGG